MADARAFTQHGVAEHILATVMERTISPPASSLDGERGTLRVWLYFGRIWLNGADSGRSDRFCSGAWGRNGRYLRIHHRSHYNGAAHVCSHHHNWHGTKSIHPDAKNEHPIYQTMEWYYFGNCGYLVVGIIHLDESILPLTFHINTYVFVSKRRVHT